MWKELVGPCCLCSVHCLMGWIWRKIGGSRRENKIEQSRRENEIERSRRENDIARRWREKKRG